jgi:hypothetical protein
MERCGCWVGDPRVCRPHAEAVPSPPNPLREGGATTLERGFVELALEGRPRLIGAKRELRQALGM